MKWLSLLLLMALLLSCQSPQQHSNPLQAEIMRIVAGKNAIVGVSIIGNQGTEVVSLNGDRRCPLQSVFKLHIALAVLAEVDKGNLSLEQEVLVNADDMLPEGFWSPLRDENPEGGVFTVARLIQYSVSQSDNVACDVLIRLIGTPSTVEQSIKRAGIDSLAIVYNEEEMQSRWENMYANWTTPNAASRMLQLFYENNGLLSKESHAFIWKTLLETSTGLDRLKGRLPDSSLAHKTGSSGTNEHGLTPATNDIGVFTLPDGSHFIISVFVSESYESDETNAALIADIAHAAYTHFNTSEFN
jgi:beta-lactamase class A